MKKQTPVDKLVYGSVFGESEDERREARAAIRRKAKDAGIYAASIHQFYLAYGRGEVGGFTVPACNIRALAYDTARIVFRLMIQESMGAVIFEIARGEQTYTNQTADEYAVSILAAAIAEGWKGPVFIQADHTQFSAKKYQATPDVALEDLRKVIKSAVDAGFYNIDIDASTLVDLTKASLDEQQKTNYEMTAVLTRFIREIEPAGVTVSIGGEIGHIGGKNSTVGEFRAFMDGYAKKTEGLVGMSKVSVQTGTSHGGKVLPDGTIAKASVDFSVLKEIGAVARRDYGIGGPVQHGASTLSGDMFYRFPEAETLEIHFATGFQNTVYEHLPPPLRDEMYAWVMAHCSAERKPEWNDDQFLYKLRKKAIGPFKKQLWMLSDEAKQPIIAALTREFTSMFAQLKIKGTRGLIEKYSQSP